MTTGTRPLALAAAVLAAGALGSCAPRAAAPGGAAPVPASITAAGIHELTRDPSASVVVVNVWASWCAPCRDELPALVKLQHDLGDEGMRLVLVSADFDVPMDKLTAFLASQGIDFQTYIRTERDEAFMESMSPDWSGAIPATFVYNKKGELFDFWEGMATFETFEAKVREAMKEGS